MRYIIAILFSFLLVGCLENGNVGQAKNVQAEKAKAAADSIAFTENAEIDNIKKRLELTANPGLLGYIVLMNDAGQPVMYTGVKGKVTSGGKRLTATQKVGRYSEHPHVTDAPSDEGTYGHSGEYIFFWTPAGQYVQWNGGYLYSDKPFRLKVEPLAVAIEKN